VPLERLEAQICELAGHLAAATCRFLVLLGDFDARRGWADWEMSSCAAWLSWKCCRPDGTAIPASPPLPQPGGTIGNCHEADITPETIIPPWYGERLDLDHAIYVCFANAARRRDGGQQPAQASHGGQAGQDGQAEPFRPRDLEWDWARNRPMELHEWIAFLRGE
jgi:hypothetical protein